MGNCYNQNLFIINKINRFKVNKEIIQFEETINNIFQIDTNLSKITN